MEKEIWKKINNYENYYEISNFGNIRSLDRYVRDANGLRLIKGKILTPKNHTSGYYQIVLSKEGKNKYKYIHRLVAEHFIENYSELLVINHKDGNKINNNLLNLECVTQKQNIHHALKNGFMNISGENHYRAKFNNSEILKIRELYKEGKTLKELSILYNSNKPVICRIVNNKVYKDPNLNK